MNMAAKSYYEPPTATPGSYESITMISWGIYWYGQRTEYKGLKEDLISAGIVPAGMFSEMGKSGIKQGSFKYGPIQRIQLKKAGKLFWTATVVHEKWKPPYESEKTRCTVENISFSSLNSKPSCEGTNIIEAAAMFKYRGKMAVASDINQAGDDKEDELGKYLNGIGYFLLGMPQCEVRDELRRVWEKHSIETPPWQ
jgi:hypothetical protein